MFVFWVNTEDGRVATYGQLEVAGLVENEKPVSPWHRIQGPSDASTMWYTVLRRKTNRVYIGTLCFRHTPRQASLEEAGWEEVPIEEIGV
jgi:alkylated DNA nucleotide flippase Atl1